MASSSPLTGRTTVSTLGARTPSRPSVRKAPSRSVIGSQTDRWRKWLAGAAGLLAVVVLGWMIWIRLPPPQLKTDEQVFTTVDALFTAITSRDKTRLEDCERRLKTYHAEGKTSAAVSARLDAIIQQARDGQWEPAARKLYDFMLGQRG